MAWRGRGLARFRVVVHVAHEQRILLQPLAAFLVDQFGNQLRHGHYREGPFFDQVAPRPPPEPAAWPRATTGSPEVMTRSFSLSVTAPPTRGRWWRFLFTLQQNSSLLRTRSLTPPDLPPLQSSPSGKCASPLVELMQSRIAESSGSASEVSKVRVPPPLAVTSIRSSRCPLVRMKIAPLFRIGCGGISGNRASNSASSFKGVSRAKAGERFHAARRLDLPLEGRHWGG